MKKSWTHWPYKKLQKYNIATASDKNKTDRNRRAHVGRLVKEARRRLCHKENSISDRNIVAIEPRVFFLTTSSTQTPDFHPKAPNRFSFFLVV